MNFWFGGCCKSWTVLNRVQNRLQSIKFFLHKFIFANILISGRIGKGAAHAVVNHIVWNQANMWLVIFSKIVTKKQNRLSSCFLTPFTN